MSDGTNFDRADTIGAARHDAMEKSRKANAATDSKSLQLLQSQLGVGTTGNGSK